LIGFSKFRDHMTTEEKQALTKTFEAMAVAYERWAEPVSAQLAEVALKCAGLSKGSCVLDVGAGTGALAIQAAALGHDVLAIDIAPAMVTRVKERLRGYGTSEARVMDGQHLDLRDNSFDAAFSVFAATLFPDSQQALSEMVRVIRPGGALSIVHWGTPSGADIFVILSRALQGLGLGAGAVTAPRITALLSPEHLREVLIGLGCVDVSVETVRAASVLPKTESFMDELDPIFRALPAYRDLSEEQRATLRPILEQEVDNWRASRDIDNERAMANVATARLPTPLAPVGGTM
jgi:ubiquinone/menaquinone biosynthesis C-methylase UbiE